MGDRAVRWFFGSGGPMVVLPEQLLDDWSGTDAPPAGRIVRANARAVPAGPATDFDRACDIEDLVASIEVGGGRGLVLGGECHPTTVLRRGSDVLLVRWVQGDAEEPLLRHAERYEGPFDGDAVALVEAHPGPLWLFDSACPGPEVDDDRLEVPLHPGRYMASAAEHRPDDDTLLILVRLERVG